MNPRLAKVTSEKSGVSRRLRMFPVKVAMYPPERGRPRGGVDLRVPSRGRDVIFSIAISSGSPKRHRPAHIGAQAKKTAAMPDVMLRLEIMRAIFWRRRPHSGGDRDPAGPDA
ncbi:MULTISPECIES: hypothetical protein [Thermomonosporaceae]|uniref:hypothetical protein n=1 Tax=Thermomonosporaceae TaxID=2012 RepID=UPI00255AD802|nr:MULTISPECIES: hypothetical protein [Thermomonosporaceae]MDL4777355.1 hypothetical protein [Actinomadura xylanilytica]